MNPLSTPTPSPGKHGLTLHTALAGVITAALVWPVTAQAEDTEAFITTWETLEADEEVFIPTAPYTDYDFTIDWGTASWRRSPAAIRTPLTPTRSQVSTR